MGAREIERGREKKHACMHAFSHTLSFSPPPFPTAKILKQMAAQGDLDVILTVESAGVICKTFLEHVKVRFPSLDTTTGVDSIALARALCALAFPVALDTGDVDMEKLTVELEHVSVCVCV